MRNAERSQNGKLSAKYVNIFMWEWNQKWQDQDSQDSQDRPYHKSFTGGHFLIFPHNYTMTDYMSIWIPDITMSHILFCYQTAMKTTVNGGMTREKWKDAGALTTISASLKMAKFLSFKFIMQSNAANKHMKPSWTIHILYYQHAFVGYRIFSKRIFK